MSQIENQHNNAREEYNAEQDIDLMNTEKQILEEKIKLDLKVKQLGNENLTHEREQNALKAQAQLEEKGKINVLFYKN
jgi:hypothetical protein